MSKNDAELVGWYHKNVGSEIKHVMNIELENHDWMKQMKLKCQAYIRNNGIKTTTDEEIADFLMEDAVRTFPQDVFNRCLVHVQEIVEGVDLAPTQQ